MQFEDRIVISTPEGLDLELILAGLGSRIAAAFVDAMIRGLLYLALAVVFGVLVAGGSGGPALGVAVFVPAVFVIEIGYDIAFETLRSGRTPGKSSAGIRVVRLGGHPVDFRTSAVRNLLRLVDGPLTGYVAGVLSILVSSRNQRLGDMAAGTIVVRDRIETLEGSVDYVYEADASVRSWDVSAVTADEVAALRAFLERRNTLAAEARTRVARRLAERLRPKVAGAPERMHPEAFVESIVRAKTERAAPSAVAGQPPRRSDGEVAGDGEGQGEGRDRPPRRARKPRDR